MEVKGMINKVINVEGMSCDHCRNAVESALAKLNGVTSAEVDLATMENKIRIRNLLLLGSQSNQGKSDLNISKL